MPKITRKPVQTLDTVKEGRTFRAVLPVAALSLYGLASAQATDAATQLTSAAKTQMEAVVPLLVGLLVVGIGITVAFFVNKNAKKGVKSAG